VRPSRALLAGAVFSAACFDATGVVLQSGSDAALDGTSEGAEAGAPPSVRLAYVSGDAGALVFCATAVGASTPALVVSGVAQLQVTAPSPLEAGTYDLAVAASPETSCALPLAEALDQPLVAGAHTVALLGDPEPADGGLSAHPLTMTVLDDDPPRASGAALRPLDVASKEAALSLSLDDGGATPLSYGSLVSQGASPNGYVPLGAGAHELTLAWGGSDSFALAAASGGLYSLFAFDVTSITPQGAVKALVCDDRSFDAGFTSCTLP